ncbi:hypothetical protein D9M73_180110 [compost metagenome]
MDRRLPAGNRIDIVHAGDHAPEDGVFLVELHRRVEHDEELAVGAIFRLGHFLDGRTLGRSLARRRHGTAHMRQPVELGGHVGQRRSTRAVALRVAGLRHEAFDHAVEQQPIIEMLARQRLDPLDHFRRGVGTQPDDDATAGRQVEIQQILGVRRRGNRRTPDRGNDGALWIHLLFGSKSGPGDEREEEDQKGGNETHHFPAKNSVWTRA